MKRQPIVPLLLAVLCILWTSGCNGNTQSAVEPSTEVVVFAAASMTETLTELAERYQTTHPEIHLVFNFDSSGTLLTQIQEGAVCDVFLSAGQPQMDQLDNTAPAAQNPDGLDCILEGTRFNLLENKVVLAVPDGNPAGIYSFEDMKDRLIDGTLFMAMGGSDVPVGQYTQALLTWFGLNEEKFARGGCITYASNVKEITTQIQEAVVDCGVVYQTDAHSAGLTVADTASPEMCGQVIYPIAVMKSSQVSEAAQDFLEYLTGDEAADVFSQAGFTPIA